MGHPFSNPPTTERRWWTLLAGGTFGVVGLGAAVVVWTALLMFFGDLSAATVSRLSVPGERLLTTALWVLLGLGAPVVGAVTTGTPLWYVLVERVGVGHFAENSGSAYPLLGGAAGIGTGVLGHFVMWGIIGVALVVYGAATGSFAPGILLLVPIAGLYSVLIGGIVTVPAAAVAGGLLGYARVRLAGGSTDDGHDWSPAS